jgi:hypothetical protein
MGEPVIPKRPSRRQIVFNWVMGEELDQPDGWWSGSDGVAKVDELLAALDAAAEAKVAEQAATIAAAELRLSDQHATIVRDAATIERLREAVGLFVKYAPFSGDIALMIRASQPGGAEAHERANKLIEFYEHLNEAHSKGAEALNPQPSQPEYTSESMVQPKEKP